MHYQQTKRYYLIKTGLLLLTALCANAHATQLNKKLQQYHGTLPFATILHTIDTSSCYDWVRDINMPNARKMQTALMAQLWKIVWLSIVGVAQRQKILFGYAVLSKLIIDLLAQWGRNTKVATILSHWPIAWALVDVYLVLYEPSNPSWEEYYTTFSFTFGTYYVAQKCYQPLRKKIIGHACQRSNGSYLFDVCLGTSCIVVNDLLSNQLVKSFFCGVFPFVVLVLEPL